jgi:hypothetical protein
MNEGSPSIASFLQTLCWSFMGIPPAASPWLPWALGHDKKDSCFLHSLGLLHPAHIVKLTSLSEVTSPFLFLKSRHFYFPGQASVGEVL